MVRVGRSRPSEQVLIFVPLQTRSEHSVLFLQSMPAIDKDVKVLVSGANGFLAMWVVRILLERGFTVRGTVRSADKGKHVIDYFTLLGYGDKIDVVVVEDITKVK